MPWAVAAAVVGAGAVIYSSHKSSEAIDESTEKSVEQQADTNVMLQEQYDQNRADTEPWRMAGEQALKEIQSTPDFSFTSKDFDFFTDPSYAFRKQEGIDALDASAASRGRLLSGGQDRAVTRYASDLASQEYNNAFNRHQSEEAQDFNQEKSIYDTNMNTQKSLAGVGQEANTTNINAGTNTTNAMVTNNTNATSSQNSLTMAGAQNSSNMATGIATSVNQGIGNYLLAQKSEG